MKYWKTLDEITMAHPGGVGGPPRVELARLELGRTVVAGREHVLLGFAWVERPRGGVARRGVTLGSYTSTAAGWRKDAGVTLAQRESARRLADLLLTCWPNGNLTAPTPTPPAGESGMDGAEGVDGVGAEVGAESTLLAEVVLIAGPGQGGSDRWQFRVDLWDKRGDGVLLVGRLGAAFVDYPADAEISREEVEALAWDALPEPWKVRELTLSAELQQLLQIGPMHLALTDLKLERATCTGGSQVAKIRAAVRAAMEIAGNRWSEWGDRALSVEAALGAAIAVED